MGVFALSWNHKKPGKFFKPFENSFFVKFEKIHQFFIFLIWLSQCSSGLNLLNIQIRSYTEIGLH